MGAGLTAQDWLVRLLPVALLIVVGLAGLRGAVGPVSWDGPLHREAVIVGVDLEAVIATLVASLPPRVCVNEILISPTHNRGFIQTPGSLD